ncbi:MAG: class I adenylate cyclase [Syntrophales bacterium LBB04]|nr:class I adenylate cyclase [Syntrophales bacterium LBB04]
MQPSTRASLIQGIYTIGSVGTISQTESSDCDIWICINNEDFEGKLMEQLSHKVALIKDWLDANLKMPVYFFISNLEDIRNSNFGTLDDESCGSAQRNVLKEEFYRTVITIAGKIPLWWLCYDPKESCDYASFCDQYRNGAFGDYDCIDMRGLDAVDDDEYFGAALWQFNKALTHPLKSIIKMLLLKMLLLSTGEELLCNRFRKKVLDQGLDYHFVDPSMFTMSAVLDHNQDIEGETFEFIKKCFYLRYGIKYFSKNPTLKEVLAKDNFLAHPLSREIMYRLNDFPNWPLLDQLDFGVKIFVLLISVYKEIKDTGENIIGGITPQDLTVVGRKLSVCLEKKKNKVAIVHKPIHNLNIPTITFMYDKNVWHVFNASDMSKPLVSNRDIVYCIVYLIWNDIYQVGDVRMKPNPTSLTINEITNLAKKIKGTFNSFDVSEIDFNNFLEPEKATKMLVVISFDESHHAKDINDLCVIYCNHWGELFVKRFNSLEKLKEFVSEGGSKFSQVDISYYIQRSSYAYEKIIERTKKVVAQIFSNMNR